MRSPIVQLVVFERATGKVVSSGTTQLPETLVTDTLDVLVGAQARPGFAYVQGNAVVEILPQPSPDHVYNWDIKQWLDPRTLDDLKATAWERIKAARDTALGSPLSTHYGVFDADTASAAKIAQAVVLADQSIRRALDIDIYFTLHDNTVATLTAEQMVDVGLVLAQREQALRAVATGLRDQINNALNAEQLAAIVWPAAI